MPTLSLAEAAKHCGVNRSTILRAVKSGKMSGTRNDDGSWSVEPSELFRVFEPKADTSAAPQGAQRDAATDALVAELRAVIADLRRDRDAWRDQAERPPRASSDATPQPEEVRTAVPTIGPRLPSRFLRAWRLMRGTGCLAGVGLLLAFATVDAGAQQEQALAQDCFTVAMSVTGSTGSILLNRCTGNAWLLARTAIPGGYTLRWHPIMVDENEPSALGPPVLPSRPAR
jgi:hypothetical protein